MCLLEDQEKVLLPGDVKGIIMFLKVLLGVVVETIVCLLEDREKVLLLGDVKGMKQDIEVIEMHPGVQDHIQKVAVVLPAPDDGEDHQLLAHLQTHLIDLRVL